jgi:hypothetical protein
MRSKTLEIRQVKWSHVRHRESRRAYRRTFPFLSLSWHGTSPIFAADYQPWSAAQLRKVLPFPTSSGSQNNGFPSIPESSTSSVVSGLLGTPSRRQEDNESGMPTPTASSSTAGAGQTTPTPARSGVPIDSTPVPATSTSAGGFNASAARVYRLATAGADSCVRVSCSIALTSRPCLSLNSNTPFRCGPFILMSLLVPTSTLQRGSKHLLTLLELSMLHRSRDIPVR